MVFCGSCGKEASNEHRFCIVCGAQLVEMADIEMDLEEASQVVKEEYKANTVVPDQDSSNGTHIGDQKRRGEWLEYTVDHILRYAGFQTEREAKFVFNDRTGDKFAIDVLARDADIEIFVECKDYNDLKLSEKIMYTLKGQLDDYRKHSNKKVVGILAMTAVDDGRNSGIRERLEKEHAFLWDGLFIENLQNKMIQFGNAEDFRRYVLDHLDVFEEPTDKNNDGLYNFMAKYSFYTVAPDRYVGREFEIMNFINDIKHKLKNDNIKIINKKFEVLKEDKRVFGYRIILDFSMLLSKDQVQKYAAKHTGFFDKILRKSPYEITWRGYKSELETSLQNIYGIRFDPKSKSIFDQITYEGGRII
jgi:hypothetical protein